MDPDRSGRHESRVGQSSQPPGARRDQQQGVRRNTIIALIFLLAAIAIAGVLGVIRIYQMTG